MLPNYSFFAINFTDTYVLFYAETPNALNLTVEMLMDIRIC